MRKCAQRAGCLIHDPRVMICSTLHHHLHDHTEQWETGWVRSREMYETDSELEWRVHQRRTTASFISAKR